MLALSCLGLISHYFTFTCTHKGRGLQQEAFSNIVLVKIDGAARPILELRSAPRGKHGCNGNITCFKNVMPSKALEHNAPQTANRFNVFERSIVERMSSSIQGRSG